MIHDFTGARVILFGNTKIPRVFGGTITKFNGTIRRGVAIKGSKLLIRDRFIVIDLPNGTAWGIGGCVQLIAGPKHQIEFADQGLTKKEKAAKYGFCLFTWDQVVQYSKLKDGQVLERNRDLCMECLTLTNTCSKNSVWFCKTCGHTWRENIDDQLPELDFEN